MKFWILISTILLFTATFGFSQEISNTMPVMDITNTEILNSSPVTNLVSFELTETAFEIKKQNIIQLVSRKKSPYTAALLSFFYSGAGQFYNTDYSLGSLFFLGETVYYLLFYGMRIKFQNTYGGSVGFAALNPSDKVLIISSFAVYLGLKFLSVSDAYRSAVEYNEKIDETLNRIHVSLAPSDLSLTYSLRF